MTTKGWTMLRDLILKAGPKRKTVDVADIGSVTVRGLTAGEAMEFHRRQASAADSAVYYLLTTCVLDETGKECFSDDDINALKSVGGHVVNSIVAAILDASGLSDVTAEKK